MAGWTGFVGLLLLGAAVVHAQADTTASGDATPQAVGQTPTNTNVQPPTDTTAVAPGAGRQPASDPPLPNAPATPSAQEEPGLMQLSH